MDVSEMPSACKLVAGGKLVKQYGALYFLRDDTEMRRGCDDFSGFEEACSLFRAEPYGRVKVFCCGKEDSIRLSDAEVRIRECGEMPTAMLALSHILCGLTKLHDAPVSAQCHFDRAIAELSAVTRWRPEDESEQGILNDAIKHMAFYNLPKKHE